MILPPLFLLGVDEPPPLELLDPPPPPHPLLKLKIVRLTKGNVVRGGGGWAKRRVYTL